MPFGRLADRVARAVRLAERPGRSFRVEAVRRGPSDGSILVTDAAAPGRYAFVEVRAGRLPPGFRAELDAFLAG